MRALHNVLNVHKQRTQLKQQTQRIRYALKTQDRFYPCLLAVAIDTCVSCVKTYAMALLPYVAYVALDEKQA